MIFTYTVLHLPHFCHLLASWLLAQIPTHLVHNLIYAHDFNSHLKLMSPKAMKQSESEVPQSCLTLCNLWTVAHQAPPSMGFSRQEYWSGLPFPSPKLSTEELLLLNCGVGEDSGGPLDCKEIQPVHPKGH